MKWWIRSRRQHLSALIWLAKISFLVSPPEVDSILLSHHSNHILHQKFWPFLHKSFHFAFVSSSILRRKFMTPPAVLDDINKLTERKAAAIASRDKIADRLRNYTCADPARNTTEGKSSYNFTSTAGLHVVNTLMDHTHAKVTTLLHCRITTMLSPWWQAAMASLFHSSLLPFPLGIVLVIFFCWPSWARPG